MGINNSKSQWKLWESVIKHHFTNILIQRSLHHQQQIFKSSARASEAKRPSAHALSEQLIFKKWDWNHCVKIVQVRSFFWSVFSPKCGEIRTRKNSVFGHFLCRECIWLLPCFLVWSNYKNWIKEWRLLFFWILPVCSRKNYS